MTNPAADAKMAKVQALLDKAARSEFPKEREECRRLADKLMVKYAIQEHELDAARASRGEAPLSTPETREFKLRGGIGAWGGYIDWLLSVVVHGTGGRLLDKGWERVEREEAPGTFEWVKNKTLVGYRSELVYAEMLFLGLQLEMLKSLEPEADPAQTYDANVYFLHDCGVKWADIYPLIEKFCEATGEKLQPFSSLKRAYHRECARRGEEPTPIQSSKTYQESFSEGFIVRIATRLRQRASEPGTALVLRDRESKVEDLYQSLLPVREPAADNGSKRKRVAKVKPLPYSPLGASRGQAAADRADISAPGSHVSGSPVGRIG